MSTPRETRPVEHITRAEEHIRQAEAIIASHARPSPAILLELAMAQLRLAEVQMTGRQRA
jgi:hypothetical protein